MLKESEGDTGERNSFTEKKGDDDDDDGDVNIDEEEGSEKGKGVANSTLYPKVSIKISAKPSKPAENVPPTFESYDFSLLDELFSMLDSDRNGEDIEPILAGYFTKVVTTFMGKIKTKMLQYILLKREGDVYNRLLAVLQHHSLAQLLIELLQVKVVNGQNHGGASGGVFGAKSKGFTFGGSGDDSEEDDKGSHEEVKLSPEEQKMTEVLN